MSKTKKAAIGLELNTVTEVRLADLYQGELEEPYRPWRPGDEDEETYTDDEDVEEAA